MIERRKGCTKEGRKRDRGRTRARSGEAWREDGEVMKTSETKVG